MHFSCYHSRMTTLELRFQYSGEPSPAMLRALSTTRDVYGVHKISFDYAAHQMTVEYDATRHNAASITRLVRQSGLNIEQGKAPLSAQEADSATVV